MDEFTPYDKTRVNYQVTFLMFTFDKLMERIKEKESKLILTLKEIKMETSPSGVDERIHQFNIWMKNFHQKRSMPNIIQEVIKKLSFEKTPAVRTVLKCV